MSIEKYIQALLFKHECVIVPGFGAFLTNYVPANTNTNETLLYPPKKQLSFNASLTLNDGLLASHIAQDLKISTKEALACIQERVDKYNQLLSKYHKFKINELGLLYFQNNRLMFEPDRETNFLLSGFGLDSVVIPAIQHAALTSSTSGRKWYWAAAVLFPFIAVSLWLSVPTNYTSVMAGLNPFDVVEATYQARTTYLAETPEEILEVKELVVETTEAIAVKKGAKDVVAIKTTLNFYVVAGSFKKAQNAKALVSALKTQGFAKAELLENNNGLYRVVFASFMSNHDAKSFLLNVRQTNMKDAWILNN
ncbi:MAG: nucleoid DNA-binding protein [Flavobacteriales bacterium]